MAGTAHRASLTVAAAGGFAFLFISYHTEDDGGNNQDQRKADDDGGDVLGNPCKHNARLLSMDKALFNSYFCCQLSCFFIWSEQHIQYAGKEQEGHDESDHMQIPGKGRTNLENDQRYHISE